MLDDRLKNVAVIGAAGKMGKGIAALLLQEMARIEAEQTGNIGKAGYFLHLIDLNEEMFPNIKRMLRAHIRRFAEKSINTLREFSAGVPALISNGDIIEAFVNGALDMVYLHTDIAAAKNAFLIFEAAAEDVEIKAAIFRQLNAIGRADAYYLTNTSSIPIHVLSEKSGARLIGFHFYHPPTAQKLLELIPPSNAAPKLVEEGKELAKRLGKIVVTSKDVSGFIGNGYFAREIDLACRMVKSLEETCPQETAIASVNEVTQKFLLRPMGIFQLLDYVGIDVCRKILAIMKTYLNITFQTELIDSIFAKGKWGGQDADGMQKEGFFSYEGMQPIKIFSHEANTYCPIPETQLGDFGPFTWKSLYKKKDKEAFLQHYFHDLFLTDSLGARLTKTFFVHEQQIAQHLVEEGVAETLDDVNTVLIYGFSHLYGVDLLKNVEPAAP